MWMWMWRKFNPFWPEKPPRKLRKFCHQIEKFSSTFIHFPSPLECAPFGGALAFGLCFMISSFVAGCWLMIATIPILASDQIESFSAIFVLRPLERQAFCTLKLFRFTSFTPHITSLHLQMAEKSKVAELDRKFSRSSFFSYSNWAPKCIFHPNPWIRFKTRTWQLRNKFDKPLYGTLCHNTND